MDVMATARAWRGDPSNFTETPVLTIGCDRFPNVCNWFTFILTPKRMQKSFNWPFAGTLDCLLKTNSLGDLQKNDYDPAMQNYSISPKMS
jgi:hypothetical protein